MAWFKEWFNTPYYHKLYQHRDHEEAEHFLDNLLNAIHLTPYAKVMDLACGKGRHALYLNKHQLDVTGTDLSSENIKHAKQFENEHLHFAVHDMRDLFTPNTFDAVFNLFTSFGYFDDELEDLKVIQSIEHMLKPNGIFVFDYLNTSKTIENLITNEIKSIDGIDYHISRKISDNHIVKSISFEDQEKHFNFQEKVRTLELEHLNEYFNHTSLKIEHIFGDYNLNKYNSDYSDRMIIIARKK